LQQSVGNRATADFLGHRLALQREIVPLSDEFMRNEAALDAAKLVGVGLQNTTFGKWLSASKNFKVHFELIPTQKCEEGDERAGNTVYSVTGKTRGKDVRVEISRDLAWSLSQVEEPQTLDVFVQLFEKNLQKPGVNVQVLAHELTAHVAPLARYVEPILRKDKALQIDWPKLVNDKKGGSEGDPGPLSEWAQHTALGFGKNPDYDELNKVMRAVFKKKGMPTEQAEFLDAVNQEVEVFKLREQQRLGKAKPTQPGASSSSAVATSTPAPAAGAKSP
jgi:hypothetical protein